jgi:hypothetical protein
MFFHYRGAARTRPASGGMTGRYSNQLNYRTKELFILTSSDEECFSIIVVRLEPVPPQAG